MMNHMRVGSLNSLADYGLGESDIEDSDEDMETRDNRVQPIARPEPSIPVAQSRVKISARLVSYDDFAEEEDVEESFDKKNEEINEANEEITAEIKGHDEQKEKSSEEKKGVKETAEETERMVDETVFPKTGGIEAGNEDAVEESQDVSTRLMPQLPPEPIGRCSNKVQEKILSLLEKKQREKLDLNSNIQNRKDFRNPSIYEKLVSFCNLNEIGSNYPKSLFDPSCWTEESYYENLSKAQKEAYEKKEKEKAKLARTQVEFVSGTKKPEEAKKRKSKWDVTAPGVKTATPPTKVGSLVPSSVPAAVSDVISAAKKAKVSS